jgi:uncharacterized membrane protein YphA (DoxX/SURF4 family)
MQSDSPTQDGPDRAKKAGQLLTIVIAIIMLFTGVMKVTGNAAVAEELERLGLSPEIMVPLGIAEILAAVLFIVPQTAVLGAILLTGYLGGAIVTHWRVGDWFLIPIPIVIALLVWLAMALREPRLWALIPRRRFS